jgi:hypothetical protein
MFSESQMEYIMHYISFYTLIIASMVVASSWGMNKQNKIAKQKKLAKKPTVQKKNIENIHNDNYFDINRRDGKSSILENFTFINGVVRKKIKPPKHLIRGSNSRDGKIFTLSPIPNPKTKKEKIREKTSYEENLNDYRLDDIQGGEGPLDEQIKKIREDMSFDLSHITNPCTFVPQSGQDGKQKRTYNKHGEKIKFDKKKYNKVEKHSLGKIDSANMWAKIDDFNKQNNHIQQHQETNKRQ